MQVRTGRFDYESLILQPLVGHTMLSGKSAGHGPRIAAIQACSDGCPKLDTQFEQVPKLGTAPAPLFPAAEPHTTPYPAVNLRDVGQDRIRNHQRLNTGGIALIAKRMIEEDHIDSLILGCTELPLILTESPYRIPFLNTSAIHCESIIRHCIGSEEL
jgi:hypothetical protein